MKVLFDTQIFDWQINGGISRYFIELMNRMDKSPDIEVIFKCVHSYNTYIQNTKWLINKPKFTNVDFKGKLRIIKTVNEKVNRRFSNNYLDKGKQDLFQPTYFDPYFLKHIGNKPFILTVYDLTIEKFDDGSAQTKQTLRWKKQLITKATHIIAISENTKNDIVSFYGIDPIKITTIYLAGGFDPSPETNTLTNVSPDKGYILFVGSRMKYKNFINFIKEVAPVIKKHDVNLVVAGAGNLSAEETASIKSLGIFDRVISFPQVSDMHLASLYKNALVFVFPSLYEGFGIPVLEAMQCGCPTLLSNNSSLPEVGGLAAVYFDPFKNGDLAHNLDNLIPDEKLRGQMKVLGVAQSLKFNWDITADKHNSLYQYLYR